MNISKMLDFIILSLAMDEESKMVRPSKFLFREIQLLELTEWMNLIFEKRAVLNIVDSEQIA